MDIEPKPLNEKVGLAYPSKNWWMTKHKRRQASQSSQLLALEVTADNRFMIEFLQSQSICPPRDAETTWSESMEERDHTSTKQSSVRKRLTNGAHTGSTGHFYCGGGAVGDALRPAVALT